MTAMSPGAQNSCEVQRRGRGTCDAELQWLAVVAASNAVGALESSRRRAMRMNDGKVAPVVSGHRRWIPHLLQAKEDLRLAPPFGADRCYGS